MPFYAVAVAIALSTALLGFGGVFRGVFAALNHKHHSRVVDACRPTRDSRWARARR